MEGGVALAVPWDRPALMAGEAGEPPLVYLTGLGLLSSSSCWPNPTPCSWPFVLGRGVPLSQGVLDLCCLQQEPPRGPACRTLPHGSPKF